MNDYEPPIDDIIFILKHVVGYDGVAELPGFEHAGLDTVRELLDECGDFMAKVVAPTNRVGDDEGARRESDGSIVTPTGFKQAYRQYVDAGWGSVSLPEEFGGGGFPGTVGLAIKELLMSANMSFSLCPLLTQGAIEALLHYGDDALNAQYLPKMVSGEWTGTMNLTEPHAGTDVGALTTRAKPRDDGSYAISGQKIFITFGDHDMAEQIVHLVLARTPGAPAGSKGISCFVVPKFLVKDDGTLGDRNSVHTVSIERKLGIHGSPTCVLSYEDATGFLLGEENRGLRIMFVMMNTARLSAGMQGVAVAERAYQQSRAFAMERRQGLAIGAPGPDSAIIEFPDVRRMLLTQKAMIAALRSLMLLNAVQIDRSVSDPDNAARERASEIVGLLTPICKAFGSDMGNELASLALQIHGGMGFIEETGVAQHVRDVRIAAIYEGTNGVQAADLVSRKLRVRGGSSVTEFLRTMREIEAELANLGGEFEVMRLELSLQFDALEEATEWMLRTGLADPNAVLAGSSPYLRMWGLCVGGWLLARSAIAGQTVGDEDVAKTQLIMARFYVKHLLPQSAGLLSAATAGADDLLGFDAKRF